MVSKHSSANPEALYYYAKVAAAINARLCQEAKNLAATLRAFDKRCNEPSNTMSPNLAEKLCDYAERMKPEDERVGEVAQAFQQADEGQIGGSGNRGAQAVPLPSIGQLVPKLGELIAQQMVDALRAKIVSQANAEWERWNRERTKESDAEGRQILNVESGGFSHCDIVTEVRGNRLTVIGGNLSDTVGKDIVYTDKRGYLRPGKPGERYFAVVKLVPPGKKPK